MPKKQSPMLRSFIDSMRKKKANPILEQGNPRNTFSRGGLSSFTGRGLDNRLQTDKPAAIAHEGELIVPANSVAAAGGPQRLQRTIDTAVGSTPDNGMRNPNSMDSGFKRGGIVPGYERGGVVKSPVGRVQPLQGDTPEITRQAQGTPEIKTQAPQLDPVTETSTPQTSTTQNVSQSGAPAVNTDIYTQPAAQEPSRTDRTPNVIEHTTTRAHDVTDTTFDPDSIKYEESERFNLFEGLQDAQIKELQLIQSGEGTASKVVADIARSQLAGQLAAGNQQAMQTAAQLGLTGGALNAAAARAQRDSKLAQTGLEGQLAIDAVNRAENATLQLASIAERGLQFEEMRAQFGANFDLAKENFGLEVEKFNEFKQQFSDQFMLDVDKLNLTIDQVNEANLQFKETMDLAWDKFSENIRQFDSTVALQMFQTDLRKNQWVADNLLLAGDIKGAEAVYRDVLNVDVDFSMLETRQQQEELGNAIANLDGDIELLNGESIFEDGSITSDGLNTSAAGSLMRGWNAMHPDNTVTKQNALDNPDFLRWAKNTFDARMASKSPFKPQIDAMTLEDKEAFILGQTTTLPNGDQKPLYTKENINGVDRYFLTTYDKDGNPEVNWGEEYTYGGKTGIEAFELAYTNMLATRAMTMNPDGTWSMDEDDDALRALGVGKQPGGKADQIDNRLDLFYETGDPLKLTKDDVAKLDQEKINQMIEDGKILDFSANSDEWSGRGGWSTDEKMYKSTAIEKFIESNPLAHPDNKGKIIEFEGQLYVITNPSKITGNDKFRVKIMAEPIGGGEEIEIASSMRFMEAIFEPIGF